MTTMLKPTAEQKIRVDGSESKLNRRDLLFTQGRYQET